MIDQTVVKIDNVLAVRSEPIINSATAIDAKVVASRNNAASIYVLTARTKIISTTSSGSLTMLLGQGRHRQGLWPTGQIPWLLSTLNLL
jgi:hypothetical protein